MKRKIASIVIILVIIVGAAWSGARWFYDNTEGGKVILAAKTAMKDAGEKQFVWFYRTSMDQ
jgi:hypothetical protein